MSRVIDAVIAYRVLKLLVTPFNRTKAFELGIIDEKGKVLKKSKEIKDPKERNAYTLLIRFVFNLKRMLSKVGVRGPLGSAVPALLSGCRGSYNSSSMSWLLILLSNSPTFEKPCFS